MEKLKVNKNTLLIIAGVVWMIAGVNILKIGFQSYYALPKSTVIHYALSVVIYTLFNAMFKKMSVKHANRIVSYTEKQYFWTFFDAKSYIIMVFMMSMGISLRVFNLVPLVFIAVFYTGLGFALVFAGISFLSIYLTLKMQDE